MWVVTNNESETYSAQRVGDLSTHGADAAEPQDSTEQQRNLRLIDSFNVRRQQVRVYFTEATLSL